MTMGLSTEGTQPLYVSKRPQSVAETGGRKFQKIQQTQPTLATKQSAQNKRSAAGSKLGTRKATKNFKSTERKPVQGQQAPAKKSAQLKFQKEQQVSALSANIQNIKLIKSAKYNNSSALGTRNYNTSAGKQNSLSNRVNQPVSKQSSVVSRRDEIGRVKLGRGTVDNYENH